MALREGAGGLIVPQPVDNSYTRWEHLTMTTTGEKRRKDDDSAALQMMRTVLRTAVTHRDRLDEPTEKVRIPASMDGRTYIGPRFDVVEDVDVEQMRADLDQVIDILAKWSR